MRTPSNGRSYFVNVALQPINNCSPFELRRLQHLMRVKPLKYLSPDTIVGFLSLNDRFSSTHRLHSVWSPFGKLHCNAEYDGCATLLLMQRASYYLFAVPSHFLSCHFVEEIWRVPCVDKSIHSSKNRHLSAGTSWLMTTSMQQMPSKHRSSDDRRTVRRFDWS